jgi:predicted  nucleic acid-binding Zn-ribbon protein
VKTCQSFEEEVRNAQKKVDEIKEDIKTTEGDLHEPGLPDDVKNGLKAALLKLEKQLNQAEAALTDAQNALEKCKKDLEMEEHL